MSKVPASAWREMRERLTQKYEETFHEAIPPLECELSDRIFCEMISNVLTFGQQSFSTMDEVEFLQAQYKAKFGEVLTYDYMSIHTEEELITALRECLKTGKPYELPADVKALVEQGAAF